MTGIPQNIAGHAGTSRLAGSIVDPDLPIVDAHHHLWDNGLDHRYLFHDYLADVQSGHKIVGSVFVECKAMYRRSGPAHLKSVGEAEFVSGAAAMSASGLFGGARLCAGFVGYADLRSGGLLDETIVALQQASGGRLRGIRQVLRWSEEDMPDLPYRSNPPDLMTNPRFLDGLARLAEYGLSFDAFLIHRQLSEFLGLARQVPQVSIVINHLGGPVGFGPYKEKRREIMMDWRAAMTDLAACPNIVLKLGGLGMPFMGLDFADASPPLAAEQLAEAWAPLIHTGIELFGPDRCMFESNFPVDKRTVSYAKLWNVFKIIAAGYAHEEKMALFGGTASRIYRL